MSGTDMRSSSDPNAAHAVRTILEEVGLTIDDESSPVRGSLGILQSTLGALSDGRISEAVEHFDEGFKFNDHALGLEFTDKLRLTEFLQKARELFPDSALEVVSLMESGDHAIAEWRLRATQTGGHGSISYRFPFSLQGSTIVRVEHGRIVQWSDYYDSASSRRTSLASLFTEWIEY